MSVVDVSPEGLALITKWEGCVLRLYNDHVGYATVGVGHLVHKGRVGTNPKLEAPWRGGITFERAMSLLREDAAVQAAAVCKYVTRELTQPQFDALVCLSFNIGPANLSPLKCTLVRIINDGVLEPARIKAAFAMWNKSGRPKREDPGLTARRAHEAQVFNTGRY